MVRYITNIKKDYGNMIRIMIFREPRQIILPDNTIKRNINQVDEEDYRPEVSSLRRTKTLIRDLVLANDFDLFATFTFDPRKVRDRFSYACCWGKFQTWIHNQHSHSPNIKYLVVPEQHKNGAWHFHALLANYNGTMKNSHHQSSGGRDIYNITSYRSGFSTACYIDNKDMVASYVMKYITKDFIKRFNQRRFTCSRNLNRPIRTVNARIDFTFPHSTIFESDDYSLVEF